MGVRASISMFVDIHNHILPGIDDGSPTMEFALDMARLAAIDGTDTMVATPHRYWMLRRDAPAEWVRELVANLNAELSTIGIPFTVVPGVEIPLGRRVADDLAGGRLLTLGDAGEWALIELPFESIPGDAFDQLKAVVDAGFKVVLAHPERNSVIQNDLTFLERCAELGMAFQVTTGSLLGRFGQRALASAEAILRRSDTLPIVIASDTHDLNKRPPNLMSDARKAAAAIVGHDEANAMVDSRPRSMITPQRPR